MTGGSFIYRGVRRVSYLAPLPAKEFAVYILYLSAAGVVYPIVYPHESGAEVYQLSAGRGVLPRFACPVSISFIYQTELSAETGFFHNHRLSEFIKNW